jgi:hypothetical protein
MNGMKPRGDTRTTTDITQIKLTFLVTVLRQSPHWAIWLPQQGQWTAVRMRHGTRPVPGEPLVWVQASSAKKLCEEIRKAERRLRRAARQAAVREAVRADES